MRREPGVHHRGGKEVSLFKNCGDCDFETDCDWCEICSSFVCEVCDLVHDCLAPAPEPDEDDLIDEIILDSIDPNTDTPH